MKNFVLIDGSYFIFFRYYALVKWWKISKKEPQENFQECLEFIEKYGFKCPLGVKGRNSDNRLYKEKTRRYIHRVFVDRC